jgi:hypothetical protein
VNHINITHQVLEEGIDSTFILANSLFLDEEKKEGSWGLDFDGAHSSRGSGVGIVLRSLDSETTLFSYRLELIAQTTSPSMKPLSWAWIFPLI